MVLSPATEAERVAAGAHATVVGHKTQQRPLHRRPTKAERQLSLLVDFSHPASKEKEQDLLHFIQFCMRANQHQGSYSITVITL